MGQPAEDNTPSSATAEVFLLAFRALPQDARTKVIEELISDEDVWEDLEAAVLWEHRKDEPRMSFDEYLAEHEARQE